MVSLTNPGYRFRTCDALGKTGAARRMMDARGAVKLKERPRVGFGGSVDCLVRATLKADGSPLDGNLRQRKRVDVFGRSAGRPDELPSSVFPQVNLEYEGCVWELDRSLSMT